jgi:catechol-2,3-dioxygenase
VGLSLVSGSPTDSFCVLGGSCSERSLVLVAAGGPVKAQGFHHFGLRVSSRAELQASVKEARAKGLKVIAEIDYAGRHCVFVRDPDGFLIQLYADESKEPALDAIDPALALYVL